MVVGARRNYCRRHNIKRWLTFHRAVHQKKAERQKEGRTRQLTPGSPSNSYLLTSCRATRSKRRTRSNASLPVRSAGGKKECGEERRSFRGGKVWTPRYSLTTRGLANLFTPMALLPHILPCSSTCHTHTRAHTHTHMHAHYPSQYHHRHSEVVQCQEWLWIHH